MKEYKDLFKEIEKKRPSLRETSIESYILYLQNLHKSLGKSKKFDDLNWLKKPEKIIASISDKGYLSQRNILNAIIVALQAVDADEKLVKQYVEQRDKYNNKYKEDNANGVVNEKQAQNMITREELDNEIDEYGKLIKVLKLSNKEKLTPQEYKQLLIYVVLRFHQEIALRNDLATVIYMSQKHYNKLDEDDKEHLNVYIPDSQKLILNNYKTSSKYDEIIIDIPNHINKLLKLLIKQNPHNNPTHQLLMKPNGTSFTKGEYSNLLIGFFKRRIGKSISTTLLRKIYLSKYKDVLKEMKEDAKKMGHSLGVQQEVYVGN